MQKSDILSAFNKHLTELFADMRVAIPDNTDLMLAETSLVALRKANPRIVISNWKIAVADKYREDILKGNIELFLNKDYSDDLEGTEDSNTILQKIATVRKSMKSLEDSNLKKTIGYVQNLTKLCDLYHADS